MFSQLSSTPVRRPTTEVDAADGRHMLAALSRLFSLTAVCWTSSVVLARLPTGWDATSLCEYLAVEHGVHVAPGVDEASGTSLFLRLAFRPELEVQRLTDGVRAYADLERRATAA